MQVEECNIPYLLYNISTIHIYINLPHIKTYGTYTVVTKKGLRFFSGYFYSCEPACKWKPESITPFCVNLGTMITRGRETYQPTSKRMLEISTIELKKDSEAPPWPWTYIP